MTDAPDAPDAPAARSSRRAWRSHAAVLALYAGLTALQFQPLLTALATAVPADAGDPLLNTWILWWNAGHAPWTADYWHAPAFAPAPFTLALSETLLGLTPISSPLQWLGASPLLAYNITFLLTPLLNGAAAYALCLALCGQAATAAVGGLFFMLAPYRAAQLSHLQILASFYMPLALLAAHEFWRTGKRGWLVLLVAATVGNGLVSGYHLVYFALPLAAVLIWMGAGGAPRRSVVEAAGALGVASLTLGAMLLPYMQLRTRWDLRRGLEEMNLFSADLASFLTASPSLLLRPWPIVFDRPEGEVYPGALCLLAIAAGAVLAWWRSDRGSSSTGDTHAAPATWRRGVRSALLSIAVLFAAASVIALLRPTTIELGEVRISLTSLHKPLGVALTALLFVALLSPRLWRSARRGSVLALYVTIFLAAALLMLGPDAHVLGIRVWYKAPLSWLVTLPGVDSLRVPARWATIQVLAGAVVIALVATRLTAGLAPASRRIALLALGATIALEGWIRLPVAPLPAPLPVRLNAELVIELPSHGPAHDIAAMYRGMTHGRRVVNGFSGHEPPHYRSLMRDIQAGCLASLEALRRDRALDVVLHGDRDRAAETREAISRQWPDAAAEAGNGVMVWHIARGPTSASPAYDEPIELRGICGLPEGHAVAAP